MTCLNEEKETFIEAKKNYFDKRKEERNKISRYIKTIENIVPKSTRADSGSTKYASGGRLKEGYDLSNWLWVNTKIGAVNFIISLQTFDHNPNTGDLHVLMDRIGIYAYVGKYSPSDARTKMLVTDLELPLDDTDLHTLGKIITSLSECDIFKLQAQYENVLSKLDLVVSSDT